MPIYEYKCNTCGHINTILQKFNESVMPVCENCASSDLTKLISVSSFMLKGGGWYADGYCSKKSSSPSQSSCSLKSDNKKSDNVQKPSSTSCENCCQQN